MYANIMSTLAFAASITTLAVVVIGAKKVEADLDKKVEEIKTKGNQTLRNVKRLLEDIEL